MAPPPSSAPFLTPSPCGWGPRGACTPLGPRVVSKLGARGGAPPIFPLGSCATPAAPAQPPPTRQYPGLSPAGPGAGAPGRSSAAPGPAARGRGAAQAKLLSCSALSEVAAETAASRPLPGLGGSEHTHTRHHPLPALAPAAPAQTRQHPSRRPRGAQVSSGGGLGAGAPPHTPPLYRWGRILRWGGSLPPSCRAAVAFLHFAKLNVWAGFARRPPRPPGAKRGVQNGTGTGRCSYPLRQGA